GLAAGGLAAALGTLVGNQVGVRPVEFVALALFIGKAHGLDLGLDAGGALGDLILLHAREKDEDLFAGLHGSGKDISGAHLHGLGLAVGRHLQLLSGLVVEVGGQGSE